MRELVFNENMQPPKVLFTDQASGLLAWHAGQAQIALTERLTGAVEARTAATETAAEAEKNKNPTKKAIARRRAAKAELKARGVEARVRAL